MTSDSQTQFSYMWPGLVFLVGIPFLFLHGLAPYEDLLERRNRVSIKATFEEGMVVSKDAPNSLVLKDTGTQYRVRLIFRYSPRQLFGPAALNPQFPPWLLLPKVMFHWTFAPETYNSILDAQKALREYESIREFEMFMNPGMPEDATLFLWKDWFSIRIGAVFWAVAFLGFAITWILNSRSSRKRESEAEQLARFRERRHHGRGKTGQESEPLENTSDTIHE